jgi:hypothetical protein
MISFRTSILVFRSLLLMVPLLQNEGTKGTGDGEFSSCGHGIAIDESNNIYVIDRFNNQLQKFTRLLRQHIGG